jgi:arylsulfatase A-like enzyme
VTLEPSPTLQQPGYATILLNLFGGPSHLDMFDMKPDAPAEVRGEFRPIGTSLSGLQVCEHMPRIARWMHKATLIRSVTHTYNSHNPYAVLTGFTGGDDRENYYTKRSDHPGISAVCQYLGIGPHDLPGSVYLPALPGYSQGLRRAGPYDGYLGGQYDPLFADCDPKFPREFDQNQSFYDPVTPYGEPRLPTLESAPELTDEISTALIADLNRRGLLETTLVVIMGEMGRSPRANGKAGRDHWPKCGFALLFGAGVKEGFVLDASDKIGAYPTERPISSGDLVATMYHLLGVDSQMMLPDLTGRPIHIAHGGTPVVDILA